MDIVDDTVNDAFARGASDASFQKFLEEFALLLEPDIPARLESIGRSESQEAHRHQKTLRDCASALAGIAQQYANKKRTLEDIRAERLEAAKRKNDVAGKETAFALMTETRRREAEAKKEPHSIIIEDKQRLLTINRNDRAALRALEKSRTAIQLIDHEVEGFLTRQKNKIFSAYNEECAAIEAKYQTALQQEAITKATGEKQQETLQSSEKERHETAMRELQERRATIYKDALRHHNIILVPYFKRAPIAWTLDENRKVFLALIIQVNTLNLHSEPTFLSQSEETSNFVRVEVKDDETLIHCDAQASMTGDMNEDFKTHIAFKKDGIRVVRKDVLCGQDKTEHFSQDQLLQCFELLKHRWVGEGFFQGDRAAFDALCHGFETRLKKERLLRPAPEVEPPAPPPSKPPRRFSIFR